ncbi:MAG TPA: immunoglobulin domain-containing protein [Myxococcales bacterium]
MNKRVWIGCALFVAACGGREAGPTDPPTITAEPVGRAVVAGQTVTFAVTATGSPPLHYHWTRNKIALAGDAPSLQVVAADEDNDAQFAVTVTNALGEYASLDARLIVVPQSPRPPPFGDLRFQQVASPAAISGYRGFESMDVGLGLSVRSTGFTGGPLMTGDACGPAGSPADCVWLVSLLFVPPEDTSIAGVDYVTNLFESLDSDMAIFGTPDTVITGLDLHPEDDTYGISALHAARPPAFDRTILPVDAADVAQTVAAEGLKSRVVTALSENAGLVEVLSYGWQGNTTTEYETSVLSTNTSGIASAAASLASQGYIITAIGSAGGGQSLVVGTKVSGDTAPRPFLQASDLDAGGTKVLFDGGYAVVARVFDAATGHSVWLGER